MTQGLQRLSDLLWVGRPSEFGVSSSINAAHITKI